MSVLNTPGGVKPPLPDNAPPATATQQSRRAVARARAEWPHNVPIIRVGFARFHGVRRHATGRRFEAARLLADSIEGPDADVVLPITDGSTARQKVQRSFAQEFLCPVEGLRRLVPPLPTEADIENAAEHFDVSELTVRAALVNRGLVDRSCLPGA